MKKVVNAVTYFVNNLLHTWSFTSYFEVMRLPLKYLPTQLSELQLLLIVSDEYITEINTLLHYVGMIVSDSK